MFLFNFISLNTQTAVSSKKSATTQKTSSSHNPEDLVMSQPRSSQSKRNAVTYICMTVPTREPNHHPCLPACPWFYIKKKVAYNGSLGLFDSRH